MFVALAVVRCFFIYFIYTHTLCHLYDCTLLLLTYNVYAQTLFSTSCTHLYNRWVPHILCILFTIAKFFVGLECEAQHSTKRAIENVFHLFDYVWIFSWRVLNRYHFCARRISRFHFALRFSVFGFLLFSFSYSIHTLWKSRK